MGGPRKAHFYDLVFFYVSTAPKTNYISLQTPGYLNKSKENIIHANKYVCEFHLL